VYWLVPPVKPAAEMSMVENVLLAVSSTPTLLACQGAK